MKTINHEIWSFHTLVSLVRSSL